MDTPPMESHGKLVRVFPPTRSFHFHLVFSNKTESDHYCLTIWAELTARGVQVWQQKKNIPKDSDNWFSEWFPSANVSIKIVCFLTAAYIKSIYCMKEFRVAQAMDKLLVVVCEPMEAIRAVDPGQYPHASDALAYLMGGGQVIFFDSDDVVSEIVKFLPDEMAAQPEPETAASANDAGLGLPPNSAAPVPARGVGVVVAAFGASGTVAELLKSAHLGAYIDAFHSEGYEFVEDLVEEDAAVVDELLTSCGMKRPERRRFAKAIELAAGAGGDGTPEGTRSADSAASIRDTQSKEQHENTATEAKVAAEAVAAVEAQYKALMEEQAAALRRQQSELNRSAAALHADQLKVAEAQRKVEQEAASVALARKLQEEEQQAAAVTAARAEAHRQAEAERLVTRGVAGTWCVTATSKTRSGQTWKYEMDLKETPTGEVHGSGMFASKEPFKLRGARIGTKLKLTQTFDGTRNECDFEVARDGASFEGSYVQKDAKGRTTASGTTNAVRKSVAVVTGGASGLVQTPTLPPPSLNLSGNWTMVKSDNTEVQFGYTWLHIPGCDSFTGSQTSEPTYTKGRFGQVKVLQRPASHSLRGEIRRQGGETIVMWFLPQFDLCVQGKLLVGESGSLSIIDGIYGNQGVGSSNLGAFYGKRHEQ